MRRSSVDSDIARYLNVFEGVDLEYDVDAGSVKESIILNELPAAASASWVFDIDAPGLDVAFDEFHNIVFTDGDGVMRVCGGLR